MSDQTSGFIAHHPPQAFASEQIANEPFFPLISTEDARESLRLDGTAQVTRVREALIGAMAHVNSELRPWVQLQMQAGHTQLAEVPAPQIAGQSVRVHAYLRAVHHAAAAHLEDTKRAQASLPEGFSKDSRVLEAVGLRQGDHWQIVRQAIADCMSRMRETIELI